eukprot:726501-Alexandrium_andersonii.AAC.1
MKRRGTDFCCYPSRHNYEKEHRPLPSLHNDKSTKKETAPALTPHRQIHENEDRPQPAVLSPTLVPRTP